jgi:isopentenyl diphosphate isomerase/L-lactate dehydrogenase-like FMN-dependent dehydrogenase
VGRYQLLAKALGWSIILKGIQSVENAQMAVKVDVQGIVVSNHDGRQQDGGVDP